LVNAGLATTAAGQLKSALASPAQAVTVYAEFPTCSVAFYTIPAGKALIITGATFNVFATTSGFPHFLFLSAGPPASPCTHELAFASAPSSEDSVTQNQVFSPGIAVPAGDALGLSQGNDEGVAIVYGYLVPASAVPHGILMHLRAPRGLHEREPRQ